MSCEKCAKDWNEVFESRGKDKLKVQVLQVSGLGNGIFRVAACDEHFEGLKKIIEKGLKPAPKRKTTKAKPTTEKEIYKATKDDKITTEWEDVSDNDKCEN